MSDKQEQLRQMMKKKQREQAQQRKLVSPLLKINNLDQMVCIVCNNVIATESLWAPHAASKKHKENVERLKESKGKALETKKRNRETTETSQSSSLPSDFFEAEKPAKKTGGESSEGSEREKEEESNTTTQNSSSLPSDFFSDGPSDSTPSIEPIKEEVKGNNGLPKDFFEETKEAPKVLVQSSFQPAAPKPKESTSSTSNTIPQGFFKNSAKEAEKTGKPAEPVIDLEKAFALFQEQLANTAESVIEQTQEEERKIFEAIEEEEKIQSENRKNRLEAVKNKQLELKKMKEERKKQNPSKENKKEEDDNSEDDDEDLQGMFGWRSRGTK
eukprot:TRINITY_DN14935_c0_g1_i1.p1 TRINITY_DN14935_c0_g1~~TRINITY_DN14935_c0_g1_i1.p1  ORF type:complete len:329 (-),score=127.63 TRINITY_DN14935_c0_g1_i1:10-996(-)